jgi:hypothetical protein
VLGGKETDLSESLSNVLSRGLKDAAAIFCFNELSFLSIYPNTPKIVTSS